MGAQVFSDTFTRTGSAVSNGWVDFYGPGTATTNGSAMISPTTGGGGGYVHDMLTPDVDLTFDYTAGLPLVIYCRTNSTDIWGYYYVLMDNSVTQLTKRTRTTATGTSTDTNIRQDATLGGIYSGAHTWRVLFVGQTFSLYKDGILVTGFGSLDLGTEPDGSGTYFGPDMTLNGSQTCDNVLALRSTPDPGPPLVRSQAVSRAGSW